MKKTHKIILLPTEEQQGNFKKERIYPCILKHSWMFDKEEKGKLTYVNTNIRTPTQLQHLYIISDEEIKEGDLIINKQYFISDKTEHGLWQYNGKIKPNSNLKKVIASTDKSLHLSQIPESFIQAYIKSYNESNFINEVALEYEDKASLQDQSIGIFYGDTLKTREDNTVIIYQSKTYTRDEVIEIIRKRDIHHFNNSIDKLNAQKPSNWMNSNNL